MEKGKVISIASFKGGVGKTASATIMAQILAAAGYKILLIDFDAQRNASAILGAATETGENLTDLICSELNKEQVEDYIYNSSFQGVELIPSSQTISTARYVLYDLSKTDGTAYLKFKANIDKIKDNYDYIIIDTPPDMDAMSHQLSVVLATDYILIPTNSDYTGEDAISGILRLQKYAKELYNDYNGMIKGVFLTATSTRSSLDKEATDKYTETLGNLFIDNPIRREEVVRKSYNERTPLLMYKKKCKVVEDYAQLLVKIGFFDKPHMETFIEYLNTRKKV